MTRARIAGALRRRQRVHHRHSLTSEELVYELLDAHADTVRLLDEGADHGEWQRHRAYLLDLQRCGRALLAQSDDSRDRADDPRRTLPRMQTDSHGRHG